MMVLSERERERRLESDVVVSGYPPTLPERVEKDMAKGNNVQ